MQNKYDLAIADYNEAIRIDPSNAFAFRWRGNAHKAKGEREPALANYDEAIRLELNPKVNFAFPAGKGIRASGHPRRINRPDT
jgi:tetratricopeptide (TPR) repeat protein